MFKEWKERSEKGNGKEQEKYKVTDLKHLPFEGKNLISSDFPESQSQQRGSGRGGAKGGIRPVLMRTGRKSIGKDKYVHENFIMFFLCFLFFSFFLVLFFSFCLFPVLSMFSLFLSFLLFSFFFFPFSFWFVCYDLFLVAELTVFRSDLLKRDLSDPNWGKKRKEKLQRKMMKRQKKQGKKKEKRKAKTRQPKKKKKENTKTKNEKINKKDKLKVKY